MRQYFGSPYFDAVAKDRGSHSFGGQTRESRITSEVSVVYMHSHRSTGIIGSLSMCGVVFFIIGGLGMGFLSSCSKPSEATDSHGGKAPAPVSVAKATIKSLPLELTTFGSVEPLVSVSVRSQVTEVLKEVHFQKGQDITKGQVLFVMDGQTCQAAMDQAKANLERDQAQYTMVAKDADSVSNLLKNKAATQDEYDKAKAAVDSLAGTVKADRAAIAVAQLGLDHCIIKSPLSGRAGNLLVNEGNLVKADDIPLVSIVQVQPIQVSFCLSQDELPLVNQYLAKGKLKVSAYLPNRDGTPEVGELTFIENSVDKASGMIQLAATFGNQARRLWPGQYVRVVLTLTQTPCTVVPSEAIQSGRAGSYVYAVTADNKAQFRSVTPGRSWGGLTEIVQGIRADEAIVTDGQMSLAPGSKIEIKPAVRHVNPDAAPLSSDLSGGAQSRPAAASQPQMEASR